MNISSGLRNRNSNTSKKNKGFTLVEIMIVVVIVGLLAAMAIPAFLGAKEAAGDSKKAEMASAFNSQLSTAYQAGVDLSSYADAASMLTAMEARTIVIESSVGGKPIIVAVDGTPNPAAFTFTPATSTTPPKFAAVLGQPNVPATLIAATP